MKNPQTVIIPIGKLGKNKACTRYLSVHRCRQFSTRLFILLLMLLVIRMSMFIYYCQQQNPIPFSSSICGEIKPTNVGLT